MSPAQRTSVKPSRRSGARVGLDAVTTAPDLQASGMIWFLDGLGLHVPVLEDCTKAFLKLQ